MTRYTHKWLMIIPASLRATVRTWIAANIDSTGSANWFMSDLSANGVNPPSYHIAEFHLHREQARRWILRMCQLTGETPPADLQDRPRSEVRSWLLGLRDRLWTQRNVYISPAWNDLGGVPAREAALTATGLKPIVRATV